MAFEPPPVVLFKLTFTTVAKEEATNGGTNPHNSFPVFPSIANNLILGLVPYRIPLTTIGLH